MRRTLLLLGILIICGSAAVTAIPSSTGPIQHIETIDGFAENLTAGDTDHVTVTFENHVQQSLPLYTVLTVNSSAGIEGGEFTVDTTLVSENMETSHAVDLDCGYAGNRDAYEGMYLCSSGESAVLPATTEPSSNTVNAEITSALHTAPATYNFTLDIYSRLGIPAQPPLLQPAPEHEPVTIDMNGTIITVNASQDANVTAESYESLLIPHPTDTDFRTGVGINVGRDGSTVPFTGTIRLPYDASTAVNTLTLYHHDGSQWQALDSTTHLKKHRITADINGSGVYAMFGDETNPDNPKKPGKGPGGSDPDEPGDDDSTDDGTDDGSNDGIDDDPDNNNSDNDSMPDREGVDRSQDSEGAPAPACTAEDWTCSDWSICENGTQTRDCSPSRSCVADPDDAPSEERNCTSPDRGPGSGDDDPSGEDSTSADEQDSDSDDEDSETQESLGSLTGSLVSDPSRAAGIAGIVLLLIVAAVVSRGSTVRNRLQTVSKAVSKRM